jgi:hypothetical protein
MTQSSLNEISLDESGIQCVSTMCESLFGYAEYDIDALLQRLNDPG